MTSIDSLPSNINKEVCICCSLQSPMKSSLKKQLQLSLLTFIARVLGTTTNVDYYTTNGISSDSIKIKLLIQNDDNEDTLYKVLTNRIESIKKAVKSIKLNESPNKIKWIIRSLINMNEDMNNILYISYDNDSVREPITLSLETFNEYPIEVTDTYFNDSHLTVRQIVDPLLEDYGIYINHSKSFEDFSISWNYLHLFEHMSVPWKLIDDDKNVIVTNGYTSPVGICVCYRIVTNKNQLIKSYNQYIKYHNKFKSDIYNRTINKRLELEQKRTLTESLRDKRLCVFGRSDPSVYSKDGYDRSVFKYYLNQPFMILLITPVKVDVSKLSKLTPIEPCKRPLTRTFKRPTLSMLRDHSERGYIIERDSHKTSKSYNGINCSMSYINVEWVIDESKKSNKRTHKKSIKLEEDETTIDDLSECNTLLFSGLMNTDIEECKNILNKNIIPRDNIGISNIDYNFNNIGFYSLID